MKRSKFTLFVIVCFGTFCFFPPNLVSDTKLMAVDLPIVIFPPRTITGSKTLQVITIIKTLPENITELVKRRKSISEHCFN